MGCIWGRVFLISRIVLPAARFQDLGPPHLENENRGSGPPGPPHGNGCNGCNGCNGRVLRGKGQESALLLPFSFEQNQAKGSCFRLIQGSRSSYEAHLGLVCDLHDALYLVRKKPAPKASMGSEHATSRSRPALLLDASYDKKIDF